jgi:hypothetical protein
VVSLLNMIFRGDLYNFIVQVQALELPKNPKISIAGWGEKYKDLLKCNIRYSCEGVVCIVLLSAFGTWLGCCLTWVR